MKKLVLFLFLAISILGAKAEVKSMLFTMKNGEQIYLNIENMKITFADDQILIANSALNLSYPVADMVSMQFSEEEAALKLPVNPGEEFSVFTLEGRQVGTYSDIESLPQILSNGIYVIKNKNGNSFKYLLER